RAVMDNAGINPLQPTRNEAQDQFESISRIERIMSERRKDGCIFPPPAQGRLVRVALPMSTIFAKLPLSKNEKVYTSPLCKVHRRNSMSSGFVLKKSHKND